MTLIDEIHDRIESIYANPQSEARGQLGILLDEIANRPWALPEAADYLGVSPRWLEERAQSGEITPLGDGRTFWYPTLRAFKETTNARRRVTLDELARMGQETGDYEEELRP